MWGTGYIGLSTMVYFAKKKIKCVGYDINEEKIKKINSGIIPLADLKSWFGFDIKSLVKQNYLKATTNYKDLITDKFLVHFVAIPTEKDGKPYYKPLMNVLSCIAKINHKVKSPPIVIMSYSVPKVSDKKIIPFLKIKTCRLVKYIVICSSKKRLVYRRGQKPREFR